MTMHPSIAILPSIMIHVSTRLIDGDTPTRRQW